MNVLFGHLVSRHAKDRKMGQDSGSRSYMVAVAIATVSVPLRNVCYKSDRLISQKSLQTLIVQGAGERVELTGFFD